MTKNEQYQRLIVQGTKPIDALEIVFGKQNDFNTVNEQMKEPAAQIESPADEVDFIAHKHLSATR